MARGEKYPAEWKTLTDPRTGVEVLQLTDYRGHSHHPYFTNPGWHDGGRRLLFGSDRNNRTNLYSVHLETGEITQLTDADQPPPPAETSFLFTSVNPKKEEVGSTGERNGLGQCSSRGAVA
jgi:oligogalacturonide lyase